MRGLSTHEATAFTEPMKSTPHNKHTTQHNKHTTPHNKHTTPHNKCTNGEKRLRIGREEGGGDAVKETEC